ncbi:hypothetical protein [Natronorubrum sulfidifaciens]|uniref:Uncharacterized protein n=1 Tax=Natronorubrum sulfidifaciens JCM 14089 TaxID=1230460 RepID=L9W5Q5_9EURY|nr:hypothetical protein [Natronorubrum sulfidifaciens]ELY43658.1 hypothetical protein C495_12639 [Natronorubrum sulfidifaciens JCM 14089]
MRRSIVVAAVLVTLAFLFVGGPSLLFSPSTADIAPEEDDASDPELVTPDGSESGFWPYLNAREAHEKRSPLNVVVRSDAETIVQQLREHGDEDWEETDHDHFDAGELVESATNGSDADDDVVGGDLATEQTETELALSPTEVPWSKADGATRLAYLDPGAGGDAYWTTETLQLEDGEYYGYRYHIRLYESPNPDDQWVVMQTHSEHFDWFTLRHRVDGVEQAQYRLEKDLMSIPAVDEREDVTRINLGNSGPSDADGWATKVNLMSATVLLTVGLATRRDGILEPAKSKLDERLTEADRTRIEAATDRIEAGHLVLLGTIITIILGVRVMGVALDRHAGFLSVHMIAALLYPFIALGLPVSTYLIARGLTSRLDAGVVASASFAVAIWLDYGFVSLNSLPIDVVVQRMLVVIALGLIAGGAAKRATRTSPINDMLLAGVAMWVLVLVGTLFGYL